MIKNFQKLLNFLFKYSALYDILITYKIKNGEGKIEMKNIISVNIGGAELRLVSGENEEYTRRVAAHVDTKINEVLKAGSVSLVEAAILSAVNISDEYYKALETAENLRTQLKDYLEDGSRMKSEIADLKREISRLGGK